MPRTITEDDVRALEVSRPAKGQSRDDMLRQRIETLIEWTYSADIELDGITRAHLLCIAAEHSLTLGDAPRALELARAAKASGDPDSFDAVPDLVTALLTLDRGDEVTDVVKEARALVREDASALPWTVLERVGEELAYFGRLDDAERWFAMCVRVSERTNVGDLAAARALTFRWATRRRAGKPQDAMDQEAERVAAARGWENPDPLVFREDEGR